jgi:hypothetical protein
MDPYLTAYWWMVGIGGVTLALLSLSGHAHFGHGLHLDGHSAVDGHIGGGHLEGPHAEAPHGDLHAEGHGGGHDMGAHELPFTFSFLSPFVGATLVTFWGVCGLAFHYSGFHPAWTLGPAFAGGLLVAGLTMSGLNCLLRHSHGTTSFHEGWVLGLQANVTTPVPQGGVGEIAFAVKKVRRTAPARSVDGTAIARDTMVTIVDLEDATYIVEPTTDERLRHLQADG